MTLPENNSADNRHYEIVAKAIHYLRLETRQQPSLEELARHVGLSPYHLQRIFSQWAGISPKRFLQFLTRQHAKDLLRQSLSVLETTLETGLSSPGRLHDLIVQCDAVTPGEYGAQGEGLQIRWGWADSLLGPMIAGLTHRGVCFLHFAVDKRDSAQQQLQEAWPLAKFVRDDGAVQQLAENLFDAFGQRRPLNVLLKGTNFQIKVWEALLSIPAGKVATYADVAYYCQKPGAQRAVGTAIAKNPVGVLIPCHRVIRAGGEVGDYRWGADRKVALLAWESANLESSG